ncbi:hypothetical protein [Candidatus Nucleicultrix amoebiphila]|jgi:hypothetical protein|uniref:Lipoprotein n=1 Tax=Candidatus Nucleicultrix amoebiphila FS5 TaxID=1414854 RepID=A0A1W6N3K5_9PROT|nr:hypothetical protein [Candidatus Nucleicultrix amoebiphila]ARN84413.1 hypothetical protein GQ61_02720 [Candidatus Nucleicultrix amoebiphila FS5]
MSKMLGRRNSPLFSSLTFLSVSFIAACKASGESFVYFKKYKILGSLLSNSILSFISFTSVSFDAP